MKIPRPLACRLHHAIPLSVLLIVAPRMGWSKAGATSGFFQYEETQSISAPHTRPIKKVQKLWFKGQRFRREATSGGTTILTVGGPDGALLMIVGSAEAGQVSGHVPRKLAVPGLMFPVADDIRRFARRVGTEQVGQYKTDVYEWHKRLPKQTTSKKQTQQSSDRSRMITRYWLSRNLPAPVKVVTNLPGSKSVAMLQSAQLNIPVADSMFEIPKGTHIRPAAGLLKMQPGPKQQPPPTVAPPSSAPGSASPKHGGTR